MMKLNFWRRYLLIFGFSFMVLGLYMAFLKNTPAFDPFSNLIDRVFWPDQAISDETRHFKSFIFSMSGMLVMLWGMFIFYIAKNAFTPENKWAFNCIFISTTVYVAVMFPFSLHYGFFVNAASDLLTLIIIGIPLLFTRKYFV